MECEKCGGAGFYGYDVPFGHPLWNEIVDCDCLAGQALKQDRIRRKLQVAHLPLELEQKTFETLAPLEGQPNVDGETIVLSDSQIEALSMGREVVQFGYVMSRGLPRPGLFLYGDRGRGKSGIAISIVNGRVQAHGDVALYITVPDLLDHLRSTFGPKSDVSYDDLFEQVKGVSLLVLDDLGTENPTAWAVEKLYQVVDYRYRSRLLTIVTSNLSPSELTEHFDRVGDWTGKRIIDRLVTMCAVVEVAGPNLRR